MENSTTPNSSTPVFQQQKDLPGATGVLVLGILSLVFIGVIGLVLAIVALTKAKEAKAAYLLDPNAYTLSSYKNMNGGRICSIISISILCALVFVVIVVVIIANLF
jgi:hypothetical protein